MKWSSLQKMSLNLLNNFFVYRVGSWSIFLGEASAYNYSGSVKPTSFLHSFYPYGYKKFYKDWPLIKLILTATPGAKLIKLFGLVS